MIVATLDTALHSAFVQGLQVGLLAGFTSLAGMIGLRAIRRMLNA